MQVAVSSIVSLLSLFSLLFSLFTFLFSFSLPYHHRVPSTHYYPAYARYIHYHSSPIITPCLAYHQRQGYAKRNSDMDRDELMDVGGDHLCYWQNIHNHWLCIHVQHEWRLSLVSLYLGAIKIHMVTVLLFLTLYQSFLHIQRVSKPQPLHPPCSTEQCWPNDT